MGFLFNNKSNNPSARIIDKSEIDIPVVCYEQIGLYGSNTLILQKQLQLEYLGLEMMLKKYRLHLAIKNSVKQEIIVFIGTLISSCTDESLKKLLLELESWNEFTSREDKFVEKLKLVMSNQIFNANLAVYVDRKSLSYSLKNIERILLNPSKDLTEEDYLRISYVKRIVPYFIINERKIIIRKKYLIDKPSLIKMTVLSTVSLKRFVDCNFAVLIWKKSAKEINVKLRDMSVQLRRYVIVITDLDYMEQKLPKDVKIEEVKASLIKDIYFGLSEAKMKCIKILFSNINDRKSLVPAFEAIKVFSEELIVVK